MFQSHWFSEIHMSEKPPRAFGLTVGAALSGSRRIRPLLFQLRGLAWSRGSAKSKGRVADEPLTDQRTRRIVSPYSASIPEVPRPQKHFWLSVLSCGPDRKSTRLNSSHLGISYAVFCLKK